MALDIFKNLFATPVPANPGAFLDPRTDAEKERDVKADEVIASAVEVEYKEMKPSEVRQFGVQNQGRQSSCVANSRRKLRRITWEVNKKQKVDFSDAYIYRKRMNLPGEGMAAFDAIAIDKAGVPLYDLMPSAGLTEAQVNDLKIEPYHDEVARIFKITEEVVFTPGDLDTPAGTIQKTRKGVMMWFYFTSKEWSQEVPTIIDKTMNQYSDRALRHSVVGVEPAKYKGKEGVWIEDSAHFGGLNRRFITREFYEKRNNWASYPIDLKVIEGQKPNKPHHRFDRDLSFGMKNDADVRALQDILKFEGLLATNIPTTGNYLELTRRAVLAFQTRHQVAPAPELAAIDGKSVGAKTRAMLNDLYGV